MENHSLEIIETVIVKTRSTSVKSRADVHFRGFWIKGFKVLQNFETSKPYVTPPSYESPHGWRELFRTDAPSDWNNIVRHILDAYDNNQMKEAADDL